MADYRAAIMGYGRMARGHLHSYKANGIPVVAAADISEEALAQFRQDTDAEHTDTDYRRMLEIVQPDLVSVVTHDALHCPMVVAAAEAGVKGIICEKPMAMNLEEADQMLDACRASGSVLTISHQRYYTPQYAQARELIASGAIGQVLSADVYLLPSCIHTDGTHTIHMLLSLFGDPPVEHLLAQVDGHSGDTYFGHRSEDGGTAVIGFANQTYAHFSWGFAGLNPRKRLVPSQNFQYHRFLIHGTSGILELNGDAQVGDHPLLRIIRGSEVEPIELIPTKGSIAAEIDDVVCSIETGAPHPLSGQNGRNVLEVIMGIYESCRRRKAIQFPVEARDNPFLAMCEAGDFPT